MHLTGHSYFHPGNVDPQFRTWIPQTPVLLHVTSTSGILPLSSLLPSAIAFFMDQWKYHQLSMFVKSLPKPLRSLPALTPMESILDRKQPPQKLISLFYQALLTLTPKSWPTCLSKWESDLQYPL